MVPMKLAFRSAREQKGARTRPAILRSPSSSYGAARASAPQIRFAMNDGMSAYDAVDGSSTRHVSAEDVGAVKSSRDSEEHPCK